MATQNPGKPQKTPAPLKRAPLRNEGEAIPIQLVPNTMGGELGGPNQIKLDLHEVQAPSRRFTADGFSVIVRDNTFHLIFLQQRLDCEKLRAMVDVQMTRESATWFAKSLPEANPTLITIPALVISQEPDQTVTLTATFVRCATSPTGASLDFYMSSQFSLMAAETTNQLYVEAEVRILTSPEVCNGFVRALQSAATLLSPLSQTPAGMDTTK